MNLTFTLLWRLTMNMIWMMSLICNFKTLHGTGPAMISTKLTKRYKIILLKYR